MKLSLHLSFVIASCSLSFSQGVVNFANTFNGIDAPVTNANGNRIVGPSQYVAHFFWSSNTQATMDILEPAGFDTQFSGQYGGGYFLGGGITLPVPEIQIVAQVRVWDTNYGSIYYEARDKGGEFGFSNLITVTPSTPPGTATPLFGLQGFQLQRLPRLTMIVTTTNTIVFSWPTEQTAYAVQENLDLSQSNWVTLSNQPVTVDQQQQIVIPVPSLGRVFYRLVSQ